MTNQISYMVCLICNNIDQLNDTQNNDLQTILYRDILQDAYKITKYIATITKQNNCILTNIMLGLEDKCTKSVKILIFAYMCLCRHKRIHANKCAPL